MATNYTTYREHNLSGGEDARSSENLIPRGYAEVALNVETVKGRVRKRAGYQGRSGYVPVRVAGIDYQTGSTENLTFVLDDSINLSSIRETPLIAHGRFSSDPTYTSTTGFTSTSDRTKYYATFDADPRKTLTAPSGTLTLDASEHGYGTDNLFIGTVESTSAVDNSWQIFIPDRLETDQVSYDTDLDYTVGSDTETFVFYANKSASAGTTYVSGNTNISGGSTSTITIPAATHGLASSQMIIKIYEDTGSANRLIIADDVEIEPDADVQIVITNSGVSAIDVFAVLTNPPTANIATGSVATGETKTVSILNATAEFYFVDAYLETTVGGDRLQVIPDNVTYDAGTDILAVTFTNDMPTGANFEIYYEAGEVRTNRLTVTDEEIVSAFSDTSPQLTLWGLSHEQIYGVETAREGWVTHIDSYRRVGEERILCGLGGNLFADRLRTEVGTTYNMPQLFPSLRGRTGTDRIIGPLFHEDGQTPARSRGYITSTTVQANQVDVLSASYNEGTGYTDYVLSVPGKAILDSTGTSTTLASVITTDIDRLTINQMGFSKLNGTFEIKAIDDTSSTSITLSVSNPNITNSDYNEGDACGYAGVFTDQLSFLTTSTFVAGDILLSDGIPDSVVLTVTESVGTLVTFAGATEIISIGTGLRIAGRRTSRVIPLRDSDDVRSVTDVVAGDNLAYSPIERELRAVCINSGGDTSVSFSGDGTTLTVTLSSGDTNNLNEGQYITFVQSGDADGTFQIASVTGLTTFTITSSITTATTGTLLGYAVHVDEELTWEDTVDNSNTVTVPSRWIPIELPDDSFSETDATRVTHLDANNYESQPYLRSTISIDNMYLSNGEDEVYKFDGTSIYRAGLFRWESGMFVNSDTSVAGKIETDNPSVVVTGSAGEKFLDVTTFGDEQNFRDGDRIEDNNGNKYTIESIETEETGTGSSKLLLTSKVVGSPTSVTKLVVYRYYFRLNAVDANNNIIASAVTGSNDFTIELGASAGVRVKTVSLPAWDIYDYDRLEVEIYRTLADQPGPYYRITTIPMSYNSGDGYIDYVDSMSDDELTNIRLDAVNSALLGAELGTTFSEPLRSKYVTSTDNRLILGNIKDYPELDIRIEELGTATNLTTSDLDNITFSFRRDDSGTASATDMSEFVKYEFLTSSSGSISSIAENAGTDFTVTTGAAHGLTPGDWVYLFHNAAGNNDLTYAGWWQCGTGTTGSTIVVKYTGAVSGAGEPNTWVKATSGVDIPVYLGDDFNSEDLNYNLQTIAPRITASRRLTMAINASMRMVDRTLSGQETFTPWIVANGGGDYAPGQIVVRQPRVDSNTFEVILDSSANVGTEFNIFVNSILRSASAEVSATTRLYPSRILISFPNYAEIFDNPTAIVDSQSLSAVDVNSSDGQEITGIIPFFGESVSRDSRKEPFVVVFKTNSVYLVNTETRQITRLETQGLGCTAPGSISVSRAGIFFANDSGIYKINRSLQMEYVGENEERNWEENVNRDRLDLAQGHHYSAGRQYKLSVPIGSTSTENSEVYVYDWTDEASQAGKGSWTRFDAHDSTGWANLGRDAYWSSTRGRVFSIRRVGDETDFRDDDQPISFNFTYRAIDFGNAGSRKAIANVTTHFRVIRTTEGTSLLLAPDLSNTFETTTGFRIVDATQSSDGLSDEQGRKVLTMRSSMNKRKLTWLQIKWTNNSIDEPLEIAGFDVKVGALSRKGQVEAADT